MKPSSSEPEFYWPGTVMRKWLNISAKKSDYSADTFVVQDDDSDTDSDSQEFGQSGKASQAQFKVNNGDGVQLDRSDTFRRRRRRKSETFRAQYISKKELRICVGTWNVGGKVPPDDLNIEDWIDFDKPADIYVIGLQEIVPLNAGNVFGSEDSRLVPKWETIIRKTLNKIRHKKTKIKCYSDPSSPSRIKPFDGVHDIEDELIQSTDTETDEETHPFNEEDDNVGKINCKPIKCTSDIVIPLDLSPIHKPNRKLRRALSVTERIGLAWPEPPLELVARHGLDMPKSFKSINSSKATESFRDNNNSFKLFPIDDRVLPSDLALLAELDLESLINRKRKSFVRIVSKQMVGIYLSVWVRRSLHRHIHNVKVSTVGVGVMGYIGNKGSVSVSMSIYQTFFCFVCTHLTSGEKDGDELKRNANVQEIHRKTHFHPLPNIGLPRNIHDHERIIWLGDLNYRINLPYEKVLEFISKKKWSKLIEKDQLIKELRKGRAFDGWSEGTLNFPPTYKYEYHSDKYCGEDPKIGRRTPAWCDRILSYGKGIKLLSYRRNEQNLSDHRAVTATYMAEVEVFCPRKLQRALIFTDAEIKYSEVAADMDIEVGISHLRLGEVSSLP